MSPRERLIVETAQRLDQCLAGRWPSLERVQIRALLRAGEVLVNGEPARKAGLYVQPGDQVEAAAPEYAEEPCVVEPHPLLGVRPLDVLYADETVLVVEKPAGMPTHPQRRFVGETLAQRLIEQYPELRVVGGAGRAGIVQRVEPEMSGLVLVARTEEAYRALQRAVKRDRVTAVYSVLVEGDTEDAAVIETPLGSGARGLQAVVREGRPARTTYRRQRHYRDKFVHYTLLEVQTGSSRRHQIRVHLAWYGFPVVGDRQYGSRSQPLLEDRLFLHISALTFDHPVTGEPVRVESALPVELRGVLYYLAKPKR